MKGAMIRTMRLKWAICLFFELIGFAALRLSWDGFA
jgi:hypothetical protein